MNRRRNVWFAAGVAVTLALSAPAYSDVLWPVAVPHDFVANRPARASQVNENFDALEAAVNDVHARLALLEGRTGEYVPAGTIAFFAAASCPAGWAEYGPADGRYVVAATGASTAGAAATRGAAMSDLEDRAHSHSIAHRHIWSRYDSSPRQWYSYAATGGEVLIHDWGNGLSGDSGHRPFESDSSRTIYTSDPTSGASGTATTSQIAPYIQLRPCQKT